jgi:hypothetical protein
MYQRRDLYLDLLKKCLTYYLWGESTSTFDPSEVRSRPRRVLISALNRFLNKRGLVVMRRFEFDPKKREEGIDWPPLADTMIGLKRLDNLQQCLEYIIRHGVAGDVIETGVWRGGAAIFMRAVLKAHDVTDRCVWVADSFMGLPPPSPHLYHADQGDIHHSIPYLAITLETVKANFAKYGLLDEKVKFLVGWFKDTLPAAPIDSLALVRLDGDMYESTMDGLRYLYPKLSKCGFVIVDDYALPGCRTAVLDFRDKHGIDEPIQQIDSTGVYWQKR